MIGIFNNYKWQGKVLDVREDKSLNLIMRPEPSAAATEESSQQQQNKNNETSGQKQVFISNIPFIVGWQDLKDLFREAGNVVRADIKLG